MTTVTVTRRATGAELQAEIDRLTAAHGVQHDEINRLRAEMVALNEALEIARSRRDELMAHIEHGVALPEWATKWIAARKPEAAALEVEPGYSKEWCENMARLEGNLSITAGVNAKRVALPEAEVMGQAAADHFATLDNGDGTIAFDHCSSDDIDALVAAMLAAAPAQEKPPG